MSSLKSLARVGQMAVRQYTTKPVINKADIHPGYFKLKEIQKLYQKDDGLPVHFKRGLRDKVLYYFTLSLIGYGLYDSACFFYVMAQK